MYTEAGVTQNPSTKFAVFSVGCNKAVLRCASDTRRSESNCTSLHSRKVLLLSNVMEVNRLF